MGIRVESTFEGTDEFYGFLTNQLLLQLRASYRVEVNEVGLAGLSSGGNFVVDTQGSDRSATASERERSLKRG